jgi:hypothetical protein
VPTITHDDRGSTVVPWSMVLFVVERMKTFPILSSKKITSGRSKQTTGDIEKPELQ